MDERRTGGGKGGGKWLDLHAPSSGKAGADRCTEHAARPPVSDFGRGPKIVACTVFTAARKERPRAFCMGAPPAELVVDDTPTDLVPAPTRGVEEAGR